MNEADLLDMSNELKKKYEEFEKEKKQFELKCNNMKRHLMLLYVFSKEIDEMISDENSFPQIIKYMIERMRGVSSQLLLPDRDDEFQSLNFEFFLI